MLDLLLIATLGFLGSFGHCLGMCGSLTVAFSLSRQQSDPPQWWQQLYFHGLLNLGRIVSYALVGAAIGGLGSVLIAGGQMAGVGSVLRRVMALFTGGLLIWLGLIQLNPKLLPKLPVFHPLTQLKWHDRLSRAMVNLSLRSHGLTPALLGMVWGLIPCGFLYIAQIKAAESGSAWQGSAIMFAFGLGTLPSMVAVGVSTSFLSRDRRSQLFRMGGWITLIIGILTLLRSDAMIDLTGHGSLICLVLALIARPLSHLWPALLRYRRALGVGAFILAIAHVLHMVEHSWQWNLQAVLFMLPQHQWGILAGAIALALMLPLALTSFDLAQRALGQSWRLLHQLAVPALLLAALHSLMIGSHYLGGFQWSWVNGMAIALLGLLTLGVFLIRWRWIWSVFGLEPYYVSSKSPQSMLTRASLPADSASPNSADSAP